PTRRWTGLPPRQRSGTRSLTSPIGTSPGTDAPPTTGSTRRARRRVLPTPHPSRKESVHDTDRPRGTAGPGPPHTGGRARAHRAADRLRRRPRPGAPALQADVTAGVGPRTRGQPGRTLAAAGSGRKGADAPGDRPALRRVRAPPGGTARPAAAAAGRG